jgi:predicted unusual protein kinase regulating ubiquinone biosynthesis (AarF/ABC1/UbiB family)
MAQVVKEELGHYPEDIWSSFDPVPIASASLAQVHVARDAAGNKLAIKASATDVQNLPTLQLQHACAYAESEGVRAHML